MNEFVVRIYDSNGMGIVEADVATSEDICPKDVAQTALEDLQSVLDTLGLEIPEGRCIVTVTRTK